MAEPDSNNAEESGVIRRRGSKCVMIAYDTVSETAKMWGNRPSDPINHEVPLRYSPSPIR